MMCMCVCMGMIYDLEIPLDTNFDQQPREPADPPLLFLPRFLAHVARIQVEILYLAAERFAE